jgi:prolyl-tRNA synthetase
MVARRDQTPQQKQAYAIANLPAELAAILAEMQQNYYQAALALQQKHTRTDIKSFEDMKAFFTPQNEEKPEVHGGFVLAKWCGDPKTEEMLAELKVSIRCLPLKQSGTHGTCILTGKPATLDAIFAKSY